MLRYQFVIVISIFIFNCAYSYANQNIIPPVMYLLDEDPVDDVCPSFIAVVVGYQGVYPNTSRETGIMSLGFLNINNTDEPFTGHLIWEVTGLDDSEISINPSSGSLPFEAVSNGPSIGINSIISATAEATSGTDVPVVLTYTLITNDVNGNECDREENSRYITYSVL